MNARRLIPVVLAVASLSLGGCVAVGAGGGSNGSPAAATFAPGCGPAVDPAEPRDTFTPYEGRRGYPPDVPLDGPNALSVTLGDPNTEFLHPIPVPAKAIGLPLQATLLTPWNGMSSPDARLVMVFGSAPPGTLSWNGLLASGAWLVMESLPHGGDAATVRRSMDSVGLGDAAIGVQVGANDAVLVHADPIDPVNDRPYGLHWSDGTRDMSIEAMAPSASIIDVARSFYCSGPSGAN